MVSKCKDRIYIIGMMGSGKSSLAKKLADLLNYEYLDTDIVIETNENATVSTIFAEKGPDYFRNLERETITTLKKKHLVIACGGGLPCYNENIDYMLNNGCVIYLYCDSKTLAERLDQDNTRPLILNTDFNQKISIINDLLAERNKTYIRANVIVDVNRPMHLILNNIHQFICAVLK